MDMTPRRIYNPQFDLFLPNIVDLKFRDQKDTMERPFFSLAKSKRMRPIEYRNDNDGIFVTVQPHQDYGMATIWDADVLIWAASVLSDMKNRRLNEVPREIKFQTHDLLRVIGRATGGKDYVQLRGALDRLKSTIITTNIRVPRGNSKRIIFSWIDQWVDLIDSQTKESRGLSITLSDWFYRGIMEEGGVLSIDPAYFRISGGRERWLYRVARKHAGGNGSEGFAISMPTLFEKSGAEGTYRRFKFEMQRIVARNDLPGFLLRIRQGEGEPVLHMVRRDQLCEAELADWRANPRPRMRPAPFRPEKKTDPSPLPLMQPVPRLLTENTIARIRVDFPGWDIYALKSDFDSWIDTDPAREPKDYEAAFYGFVKQHHQRNQYQLRG